jgi:hypothetical protein
MRNSIVGAVLDEARKALAVDLIDLAHEIDHAVDRMHPHRRETAERRLRLLRAPRGRRQRQRVGIGHVGFDVLDDAKVAGLDAVAQLHHLGMEAAVVADADDALGLEHRVDRSLGLGLGEGERLLAIDVLAGARRGDDLLHVAGSWRRQHHGVDLGIGQHRLEAVGDLQRMLLGKGLDIGLHGAGLHRGEPHGVAAAGKRLDHGLAPGAKSDNRRVDHRLTPTAGSLV